MKYIKRGLAVCLSVLLMVQALPVTAAGPAVPETAEEAAAMEGEAPAEEAATEGGTSEGGDGISKEEKAPGKETDKSQGNAAGSGTTENGKPEGGTAGTGTAENSTAGTGTAENGTAGTGTAENGKPEGGTAGTGTAEGGTAEEAVSGNGVPGGVTEETVSGNGVSGGVSEETVSGNGILEGVSGNTVSGNGITEEAAKKTQKKEPSEEIFFNTGNCVYSVVGKEDFFDYELGDAYFEEDGSYTINIPEANPFFPYEVQFTYNGESVNQWFMTPEDSVTIDGHTFYVSCYFDDTAVTQMSLKVGGDTVVVYPEEKEFTDGNGAAPMSLLPLQEVWMNVDLSAYTPAELTMVSFDTIFTGDKALGDTDKVVWTYAGEDDYTVSSSGDTANFSYGTCYSYTPTWQMIVGEDDQLAASNIRYLVRIKTTESDSWLMPAVYKQDGEGNRTKLEVTNNSYYDNNSDREWGVVVPSEQLDYGTDAYLGLAVNPSVFASTKFSSLKVYEGRFTTAAEAMSGTDITDQIYGQDMTRLNAGYAVGAYYNQWITMVTLDASGNATGCLPFRLDFYSSGTSFWCSLYDGSGSGRENVVDTMETSSRDNTFEITSTLYKEYPADHEYYMTLHYSEASVENSAAVTGAYAGRYSSIAEAAAAGAADIKGALFDNSYNAGGYPADYSQGVDFTIFVGADGTDGQKIYYCRISTLNGTASKDAGKGALSGSTMVQFKGLRSQNGSYVNSYAVSAGEDSYAEYNYLTILVGRDADLTALAPEFDMEAGIHLYASGSSSPEISGESVHDFSNGPVQYTAAAENGTSSKNYWLQVVKAAEGAGRLYMNSLADHDAGTKTENGLVLSTREILLDGYHGDVHDILLANMGTEPVTALSAELVSDAVELDGYWTLSGDYDLSGCSTLDRSTSYGELPNLAKIRIKAKDGVADGTGISGTLTIKSGNTALMVLTLTGAVGDPSIVTKEIPQAVKYVPYGTMIQNNNKYSWNTVEYRMTGGALPDGMEVKANGELYGVPRETGEFTFAVSMTNSYRSFSNSEMTYTLTVLENTDFNVDGATDQGYDLTQRIQNVSPDSSADQTLVSQGIYAEFQAVYLDGSKLKKDVDYTSEAGSTRITIRSQTLKASNTAGTHTLGIEFRTKDTDSLKRAAQNYQVSAGSGGDSENGSDGTDEGNTDAGGSSGNQQVSSESADSTALKKKGTGSNAGDKASANSGEAQKETYTVQEGDTLWKISEKYYGSGIYWERIFLDNAAVVSNPDKIYAGQVLVINLEAINEEATAEDPEKTYYTVKAGDSLWKIALQFYGRGWYWRKIGRVNHITDPRFIYEGQIIILP